MILEILCFFIINWALIVRAQKAWQNRHPDVGLNVKQLIKKYGYEFENHIVESDDGYLLEVHRIAPLNKNLSDKPPVLIMSGLFCGSADWVNMGTKKSLGFILADEGYDVWLINYRGTTWSKHHKTLDYKKDMKKFFNYSFQEIGYYDLPACIDYVLNFTNQENLFYVGHSQATTSYFALLSEKPHYIEKIRLTIALSPIVTTKQCNSPVFLFLLRIQNMLKYFNKKLNWHEVMPYSRYITILAQVFCNEHSPFQIICSYLFYIVAGFSPHLNKAMIPVIVSNTPAGSSFKQVDHYLQLRQGIFRKYDYGRIKNMKKYGQPTPPEYDLSKSTVPMAAFYGTNDSLSSPKDMEHLLSVLPNVVSKKIIPGYNHIDTIWGKNVEKFIYRDIVDIIKSYS